MLHHLRVLQRLLADLVDDVEIDGVLGDEGCRRHEREEGGGARTGNPPLVFPSIEAAMENFAKINNPPRFGFDRERAVQALIKLENGYMLKRDPDNGNRKPIGEGATMPRRPTREMWA